MSEIPIDALSIESIFRLKYTHCFFATDSCIDPHQFYSRFRFADFP
jgi:hypothetical protein